MPESRSRKNASGHRVHADDIEIQPSWVDGIKLSPSWWAPVMVTLMLIGLIWLVVFYISGGHWPIPQIGNWNIGVGIGIAFIGFLMTMRWR